MVRIMSEINQDKLNKMWKKILEYEKNDGMLDKDREAISTIQKIVDEVYRECF